jgi:hypothetical protein
VQAAAEHRVLQLDVVRLREQSRFASVGTVPKNSTSPSRGAPAARQLYQLCAARGILCVGWTRFYLVWANVGRRLGAA